MEKDFYNDLIKNFYVEDKNVFRFGSIDDGGYYIKPSTILEADILFSGGISSNLEFEFDLFRFNKDIKVFMVDPTVSTLKLSVKSILRIFLGKKEKIRYLYNTLLFIYMTRTNRCWHINKWLSNENKIFDIIAEKIKLEKESKIILKLDIEGSEYELLNEIENNIELFSCLIFEFHDLDKKHEIAYDFIEKCCLKFDIVYIGINQVGGYDKNRRPKIIEVSLQRKETLN